MKFKKRLFVELLHVYGVQLSVTRSALFQANAAARPALSDKEFAFMKRTLADLDESVKRVTRLRTHLERTGR